MTPQVIEANGHEELEKLFKDAGLKMTIQRMAVLHDVMENENHPSAEAVYERVKKKLPAITLNTVYRILTTLASSGMIRRFDNLVDRSLYDGNLQEHYHFVCEDCGRIEDIYIENARELDVSGVSHTIREIDIRIRGVCRICAKK